MKFNRNTLIVACIITAVVVWSASRSVQPTPPRPDRPVLTVIARLAKTLLWMAFFAEEPPVEVNTVQSAPSQDGYPTVDHWRSL